MLTEWEARRLADLSRLILSAIESPDVETWSQSVEAGCRRVLGADVVAFSLPETSGTVVYASPEAKKHGFESYMTERLPALERAWGTKTRLLDLGVSSRRTLYAERLGDYYKSEIWNEFIVPHRFYDTLGLATRVAPGANAFLFMTHGQRTGRKFGRAGLDGLRLLQPAFRAAVRSMHRLPRVGGEISRIVDVLRTAIVLGDAHGRPTHRNPALAELLRHEPHHDVLVHAIDGMLHRVAMSARERAGLETLALWRDGASDTLRLGESRYRLSGSLIANGGVGNQGSVMVTVERSGPAPFPDDALRRRRLTAREIAVTRLVAEGGSTERIATTLGISIFTARHHLENVMRKLGAHSRAALTAIVARLGGESP